MGCGSLVAAAATAANRGAQEVLRQGPLGASESTSILVDDASHPDCLVPGRRIERKMGRHRAGVASATVATVHSVWSCGAC